MIQIEEFLVQKWVKLSVQRKVEKGVVLQATYFVVSGSS